jgi:cytochrome d ubiquinol oxidase subunit II
MIDFSSWIDLPLVWGLIIAAAIFLYSILDGFDLGCGIIFLFAPSDKCRDKIMNSVAPFWDGNETWLVLGGGGLFAAFPLAYSILLSAFYLPIIFMLIGLILRGVAFEFRFKSATTGQRKIWDISFHIGSLLASFMQGVILGNFVQGVKVIDKQFAGGALDWANGFSIITGLSIIFGNILLGSTWLIMKTDGVTQKWSRGIALYALIYVALSMVIISITMPLIDPRISNFWFSLPMFFYLLPIPTLTTIGFLMLWYDLAKTKYEVRPFIISIILFLLGFLGLSISLYPWIIPFEFTIWQAAATSSSQSLLLIGTAIFLPIILGYTGYSYYVFKGKTSHGPMY